MASCTGVSLAYMRRWRASTRSFLDRAGRPRRQGQAPEPPRRRSGESARGGAVPRRKRPVPTKLLTPRPARVAGTEIMGSRSPGAAAHLRHDRRDHPPQGRGLGKITALSSALGDRHGSQPVHQKGLCGVRGVCRGTGPQVPALPDVRAPSGRTAGNSAAGCGQQHQVLRHPGREGDRGEDEPDACVGWCPVTGIDCRRLRGSSTVPALFVPGRFPAPAELSRTYLRNPALWRLAGKQFLVIGTKLD